MQKKSVYAYISVYVYIVATWWREGLSLWVRVCMCVYVCMRVCAWFYVKISAGWRVQSIDNKFTLIIIQAIVLDRGYNS